MPIVEREKYEKTERLVNEFRKPDGLGEKLQSILIDIAQQKDNWVFLTLYFSFYLFFHPKSKNRIKRATVKIYE